ncbi:MAG: hypothetical protein IPG72_10305 [Ardenticatenales bacterium]|nr:hypothetical protein [Ardenticatenales bacterium]
MLVGGDFLPPGSDLVHKELRITVYSQPLRNTTVFGRALCVLRVRISVTTHSVRDYSDAIRRLNVLLGSQAVASWGASGIVWWCALTGMIKGSRAEPFGSDAATFVELLYRLPEQTKHRVEAALYWMREPRSHLGEGYRLDTVRAFTSYWTAFECLVAAACELVPLSKPSVEAISALAAKIWNPDRSEVDREALDRAYRMASPGFPVQARHALRTFVPNDADRAIIECFEHTDERLRLHRIRNSISHGGARAEDLIAEAHLAPREAELRRVVWGLLSGLLNKVA